VNGNLSDSKTVRVRGANRIKISKYIWKTRAVQKPNNSCMARQDITHFLGKIIRLRRREAKLSQEKLAFAAAITRNYVSLVELGSSSPSADTLDAIARALNTSGSVLWAEAESLRQTPSRRAKR
jgi:DNA-binding XRE family transcriptional regulator